MEPLPRPPSSADTTETSTGRRTHTGHPNANNPVTVFRMTSDGALNVLLHSWSVFPPTAPLIQATDGYLYVVLEQTGLGGIESVPSGHHALLPIPTSPPEFTVGIMGALVQATDGNFYGTSSRGGAFDQGTVFRWSPTGT